MQVVCKALEPMKLDGQEIKIGETFSAHLARAKEMETKGLLSINEKPFQNLEEVQVSVSLNA